MFLVNQATIAQISPNSAAELKKYYSEHISALDPIEGIYDVTVSQWGENAYTRFPAESIELDPIMIYKDMFGTFRWYGNDQVTIKKVAGNIYTFKVFYSGSDVTGTYRFDLKENSYFEVATSIPDKQLRYDMGRNYQAGFHVHFDYSCVKTYPTADMYYADRNRIAEDATPKQWSGTGFALKDGYIVTNYHVIEGAKYIRVQGVKGNFNTGYNVEIIGKDIYNDLALLKISDTSFTGFGTIPYSLSTITSEVGEDIYVLGYPLTSTMGDEIKLTTGIISSKTGYQGDVSLYQISAPIQPGNSGGPLFDKKGNIIGVVSAKHAGAENVGYAVKASYLRNLIESCVNSSIIPSTNTVSNLPLTGRVKEEKSFVYFIQCSSSNTLAKSEERVIKRPIVGSNKLNDMANNTRTSISEIRLSSNYTAITLNLDNYVWCSISPNTYIQIGSQKFNIENTNGIEFSPKKTYPPRDANGIVKKISCTLYFPPIPNKATTIDLIEPNSRWQFFNIKLLD